MNISANEVLEKFYIGKKWKEVIQVRSLTDRRKNDTFILEYEVIGANLNAIDSSYYPESGCLPDSILVLKLKPINQIVDKRFEYKKELEELADKNIELE